MSLLVSASKDSTPLLLYILPTYVAVDPTSIFPEEYISPLTDNAAELIALSVLTFSISAIIVPLALILPAATTLLALKAAVARTFPDPFGANIISLLVTDASSLKSEFWFDNLAISVPSSLNTISPPPASNLISSAASIVKSPSPLSVKVTALLPSPVIDKAPPVIRVAFWSWMSVVAVNYKLLPSPLIELLA